MKEIFRDSSPARVELYRTILEGAGIPCVVHNLATQQSIVGGVAVAFFPLPDFYPRLNVLNDDDYPEAMQLLGDPESAEPTSVNDWTCPSCAAEIPGNFDTCWNCESLRPGAPSAP